MRDTRDTVKKGTRKPVSPRTSHRGRRLADVREFLFQPEQLLPLGFQAEDGQLDVVEWLKQNRHSVQAKLLEHGAVLLRGFAVSSAETFEECAKALCSDLFTEYGDLPRAKIALNIYESTPYPPDRSILFHHEGSHTHKWPLKQWFYCALPSTAGGCTPIADGRRIYAELDESLREEFGNKGLKYVRNFIPGLDVSWQDFFKTNNRAEVESICKTGGIECAWKGETLQTFRKSRAFAAHPKTGQMVFFNQILLHHVAGLPPQVRASLLTLYPETDLPRSVYFGDGSKIPDETIRQVEQLYARVAVRFQWQVRDILLVDNMLVAHGRDPYVGPRKILVAMGEMVQYTDLASA
jgi:alpha-ketoglutarate-dependent taurine dioxygenase